MRPSLLVLSAVWLALCICLVWKEQRLTRIFFSFCGCFALVAILHRLLATVSRYSFFCVTLLNGKTNRDALVANVVGVLASGAALLACNRHGRPYTALSLIAGYLAFDQWYTALRLTMEVSWRIAEDALTLSAILVLLATLKDESSLEPRSFQIHVWIVYKLIVLLLRLLWPSSLSMHAASLSSQKAGNDVSTSRRRQDKIVALATTSRSPPPSPSPQLWTIYGVDYDLSDFVSRHPGGEQAILLGRGRDCTALFKSYHPFTSQHRAVLQRYHRNRQHRSRYGPLTMEGAQQEPSPSISIPREEDDEFYRVLCERVARTLRDQGIDPVRDRAATVQRAAYYVGIAVCVLASGWAHIRVSRRRRRGARILRYAFCLGSCVGSYGALLLNIIDRH
jgi:hypothetical protein